jgi:hypothetical protein
VRECVHSWAVWLGIGMLAVLIDPLAGQAQPPGMLAAPSSPYNRSLDEIRRASVYWERRAGPQRQVVDVVCLVPDVATFLEAITVWDESRAFPILIDDVELTFKFLRAFRPARIVRYPGRGTPIASERLWDAAIVAVGRAWADEAAGGGAAALPIPRGDSVPRRLGPTPPGAVLSSPTSPMLAGAVALAAGRFQPLVRWECGKHHADLVTRDEAVELALGIEALIADRFENYSRLGDDCDFLTLAGNGPYHYQEKDGPCAFDDLVARSAGGGARWAFTGRMLGDATASVYRAMCSLFLQPETALLWNTYTERGQPWADYALGGAAQRLAPFSAVTLREGNRAGLADWRDVFERGNRFGLVVLNSSGGPTDFNLPGGPGHTGDIPPSVPAALVSIHSFSASEPNDAQTLAGRWLANGAFVYFGSMHEPYLQSFRPAGVVAGLIAEGLPLGAAVRRNPPEPFGKPWRLVYLGDPFYQLQATERRRPRLPDWDRLAAWPGYSEPPVLDARARDDDRLNWALKRALYELQVRGDKHERPDLAAVMLAIDRTRLNLQLRPVYDALLVDTLLEAKGRDKVLERLWSIHGAGRESVVERTREALTLAALAPLVAMHDLSQAVVLWAKVVRSDPSPAFLQTLTDRVAPMANTADGRGQWRTQLLAAKQQLGDKSPLAAVIAGALARVAQSKDDRKE